MHQLSILTYHSIDNTESLLSVAPGDFSDQMAWLAREGFQGVSLREALDHLEQHGAWQDRTVVLTFDDGFANFYEQAFPVLEHYSFSATVFIVTGHMGGFNDWETPPRNLGLQRILSWQEAAELGKAGIEIGSHTRSHQDLRRCSSPQISFEIAGSIADIQNNLGFRPQTFAYPYGGVNHLVQHHASREFRASCTTELRRAYGDPLNLLPRVDMYYLRSLRRFAHLLNGQLDQYLTVRRCGRLARRLLVSYRTNVEQVVPL